MKPRRFQGAENAAFLLAALNGELGEQGGLNVARLAEIIRLLRDVQDYISAHPKGIATNDPIFGQRMEAANEYLRKYRAVPVLRSNFPLVTRRIHGWSLTWDAAEKYSLLGPIGQPDLELTAVLHAVELARGNELSSLRKCPNCQKWLFARFSHQRFCSENCKNEFHHTDPEEKKRRSEWAKHNYWLHKHKNIK